MIDVVLRISRSRFCGCGYGPVNGHVMSPSRDFVATGKRGSNQQLAKLIKHALVALLAGKAIGELHWFIEFNGLVFGWPSVIVVSSA